MKETSRPYNQLRLLRIAISVSVMVVTAVAIATGHALWLCHWQIIPALLASMGIWLVVWICVSLLAGRVYCSSICPLGTLQDCLSRLRSKRRFFYSAPMPMLRWVCFFIAIGAWVLGLTAIVELLDPAAAFGRMVGATLGSITGAAVFSVGSLIGAALTLAVIGVCSLARGRILCNSICPVGTILGATARYSLYNINVDTDACLGCNRCVEVCKAECINPAVHTVDFSRCVVCLDCVSSCPSGAIRFRRGRNKLAFPMLQPTTPAAATMVKPNEDKELIQVL